MGGEWVTDLNSTITRPATGEDEVRKLGEFLTSSNVVDIYREHPDEPECVRVAVRDDAIRGGLVYRRDILRLDTAEVPFAYLWEVSGESGPEAFRRTGEHALFDRILGDALGDLARRHVPLAYVHGELALFTRHGFVPTFYHPRVSIPVKKARQLPSPFRIRGVMSVDAPAIQRLMSANRRERPMFFATGVPNFHHYVVEGPNRRVEGYFSLSVDPESDWHPRVFVPEVEVRGRGAAMTILKHCAEHGAEVGLRMLHFPVGRDHPFAAACVQHGGAYTLRGPTRDATRDEEMIRIVSLTDLMISLQGLLTERLAASGDRGPDWELTFDVEDERVTLRAEAGTVSVATGEEDAADGGAVIRLPRWAMTQLVMGYRTADDLPASVLRTHRRRLSWLFPRTWPLSLCDHDLWELALRRKDPRYEGDILRKVRSLRFPW